MNGTFFQTGKINPVLLRTMQQQQQQQQQRALQQHQQQQQQNQHHSSRKPQNGPTHKVKQAPPAAPPPPPAPVTPPVDNSLVPPIRQTASIFKQPVTVVKSASTVRHNTMKYIVNFIYSFVLFYCIPFRKRQLLPSPRRTKMKGSLQSSRSLDSFSGRRDCLESGRRTQTSNTSQFLCPTI